MGRQTGWIFLLMTVLSAFPAQGQMRTPEELSSLPLWPGEQAAERLSPPQYVFRDANGQIVVSCPSGEHPGHRILNRFWLPNRVEPQVAISIAKTEESGEPVFVYNYELKNGDNAVLAIALWSIVGPPHQQMTVSHPVWKGSNATVPVAPQGLLPDNPAGAYISWLPVNAPQLAPGHELDGFTIHSKFLPGLTTGYAKDDGVLREPGEEFPEPVVQVLIRLQRAYVWQKPFLTVGPRFAPGTPRSEIVAAFRKDVASLIDQGLLSAKSPYVHEFMEATAMKAAPQSALEKDIDSAFRISIAAAP
jgi:hypothetical protein